MTASHTVELSACIETLFAEGDRPLVDRVAAAAAAGFRAVEIWDWRDKDLGGLRRALQRDESTLLSLCVETWQDKCQLADPAEHEEFLARVRETTRVAADLAAEKIVVLAGNFRPGVDRSRQLDTVAEVLTRAAETARNEAGDQAPQILLEVVNRQFEEPHALIADSAAALSVVRAVADPGVGFLYDRYHAILNGEALGQHLDGALPLVGHVQVADVPGRGELGAGDVDWVRELSWLLGAGYTGRIGIEAIPQGGSSAVHAAASELLARARASLRD